MKFRSGCRKSFCSLISLAIDWAASTSLLLFCFSIGIPIEFDGNIAYRFPPQATFITNGPKFFVLTIRFSDNTKAGALIKDTSLTIPFSTFASTVITPAAVSSRIVVCGSETDTIPVSMRQTATPIVSCPHIGNQPADSKYRTPTSVFGVHGSVRSVQDISSLPRGSHASRVRNQSICSFM